MSQCIREPAVHRGPGEGVFEISGEMADGPGGLNWRFRVPDGEVIEFEDGNLGQAEVCRG